ncbi:MAG: hypothetical protein Kow0059_12370 [Candidatus Sumerlaeia bacterium]
MFTAQTWSAICRSQGWRWRALWALLVVAALVRADYLSWAGVRFFPDSPSYTSVARRMLRGGTPLDPHRTLTYPVFLALNFRAFGDDNWTAVVLMQGMLGVAGVGLVFLILLKLTDNAALSWFGGMLWAVNFHAMIYDAAILTESLSVFVTLCFVYLLMEVVIRGPGWLNVALLHVALLILVFLKPVFLTMLVVPVVFCGGLWWMHRDGRIGTRFGTCFALFVLLPILTVSYANRSRYGFFHISNVGPLSLLGVVLHSGVYEHAPAEFQQVVEVIERKQKSLAGFERTNPYSFEKDIAALGPRRSSADFSYISKFCLASIGARPDLHLRYCLGNWPVLFRTSRYESKYQQTGGFVSEWAERLYMRLTSNIYKKFFWIVLFLAGVGGMVVGFVQSPPRGLALMGLVLIVFIHALALCLMAYDDWGRLRLPVDPLLIIIPLASVQAIRPFVKSLTDLVRRRRKGAAESN